MQLLIYGADNLGVIDKKLHDIGIQRILHVSGRNNREQKKIRFPKHIDYILVFTDFVNHRTAAHVKKEAKQRQIPLIFSKRSWCFLEKSLGALLQA
jgi:hypothetical protein